MIPTLQSIILAYEKPKYFENIFKTNDSVGAHHTFTHRQAEPSEQIFLELQKKLSNRKQSFKQTFISIK